MASRSR